MHSTILKITLVVLSPESLTKITRIGEGVELEIEFIQFCVCAPFTVHPRLLPCWRSDGVTPCMKLTTLSPPITLIYEHV